MTEPQSLEVSSDTIRAFHKMWDSFPHPAMLLNKSRDFIAVNKQAFGMGRPDTGKCYEVRGGAEIHAGCKANQAIEGGEAQRTLRYSESTGLLTDVYWLPVSDEKDLYVHFSIRTNVEEDPQ